MHTKKKNPHLLHRPPEHEVSLLELISGGLLNLETLESFGELSLNSSLVLSLYLGSNIGGGD